MGMLEAALMTCAYAELEAAVTAAMEAHLPEAEYATASAQVKAMAALQEAINGLKNAGFEDEEATQHAASVLERALHACEEAGVVEREIAAGRAALEEGTGTPCEPEYDNEYLEDDIMTVCR